MKNKLLTLTTTAFLFLGSTAIADDSAKGPVIMNDSQLNLIVAGNHIKFIQTPGVSKQLETGSVPSNPGASSEVKVNNLDTPAGVVCITISSNITCKL